MDRFAGIFANVFVNTLCLVPAALMYFGFHNEAESLGGAGAWFIWVACVYMALRAFVLSGFEYKNPIKEFGADDFVVWLLTLAVTLATERYVLSTVLLVSFVFLHTAIIYSNGAIKNAANGR